MANEANVISVTTFDVTAKNIDLITRQATHLVEHVAPGLGGFTKGAVLINEDRTQVLLHAQWDSREAWARAQWDEAVSVGVADLYEETASYSIHLFHEVATSSQRRG